MTVVTIRPLRDDLVRRMRASHSASARPPRELWRASRIEDESGGGFPVTGPWSFRDTCRHHNWILIGADWLQCTRCWWCKPKLGRPPKLEELPAILRDRPLPPLNGNVDMNAVYMNAGFVLDDDRRSVISAVRVRVVQHPWTVDRDGSALPLIRRCGVEVRFRGRGWREAAVFMETWLHRLIAVLRDARPRRPKALWTAIQTAMEHRWPRPWVSEQWDRLQAREDRHDQT